MTESTDLATKQTEDSGIIVRQPLKELVVQSIKDAIMREDLRPGQRLTEIGLAKRLGVGQATIREALIDLEVQGFIQRRHRHKFVTDLSRADIEAIYAVRVPLEKLAVEWLALKKGENMEGVEKAYLRMADAAQKGDLSGFKEADFAFHSALWAAAGNVYLQNVLERLVPQLFAFAIATVRHYHPPSEQLKTLADLHQSVLEGIRAGDIESAQEFLVRSMDVTWLAGLELGGHPPQTKER